MYTEFFVGAILAVWANEHVTKYDVEWGTYTGKV